MTHTAERRWTAFLFSNIAFIAGEALSVPASFLILLSSIYVFASFLSLALPPIAKNPNTGSL